jgi:hypothetical protein
LSVDRKEGSILQPAAYTKLCADSTGTADEDRDARRQYFSLTEFGKDVFALEAQRLDDLLSVARDVQLMPDRRERPETA